jgi:hypothetical protein
MVHLLRDVGTAPRPSEVSSLGKLSGILFSMPYDLVALNNVNLDLERLQELSKASA